MTTGEFSFPDSLDKIRRAMGYRRLMRSDISLWPQGDAVVFAYTDITNAVFSGGNVVLTLADALIPFDFSGSNPDNADSVKSWIAGVYEFSNARQSVRLGNISQSNFTIVGGDPENPSTTVTISKALAYHPDFLTTSGYVGKKLCIIADYGNKFAWERQMQWGNELYDNGTTSGAQTVGHLVDPSKSWADSALVGKALWLSYARYPITANNSGTITFTGAVTPGGAQHYAVLNNMSSSYYEPGRQEITPFVFYAHDGLAKGNFSGNNATITVPSFDPHTGTTAGAAGLVSDSMKIMQWDGSACSVGQTWDPVESDIWTDPNQSHNCESPNQNFTPMFPASIAGTQRLIVAESNNFFPDLDWTGMREINPFVPALFFEAAGINVFWDEAAERIYWVAMETEGGSRNGRILGHGELLPTDDEPAPGDEGFAAPESGRSYELVYSSGFTRKHPAEFKYAYPRTAFVPETAPDGMGGWTVYDPPTDAHPGYYHTRPASSYLARSTVRGVVEESADASDLIADGMRATYRGDNMRDPCLFAPFLDVTGTPTVTDTLLLTNTGEGAALKAAAARFFEGVHPGWPYRVSVYDGLCGDAGDFFATAADEVDWTGGVLRTESGTATGGSTTTLTNSARVGSGLWNPARNRWTGFTLEVEVDTDVWEKRLITAFNGTTITVGHAFSVSASGKPYRIHEPAVRLNRLKGHTLILTDPDTGTEYTAEILGNDANTVFFAPISGAHPAADWKMRIEEFLPGAVLDRVDGVWQVPAGKTQDQALALAPDVVTRYGYYRVGDYIAKSLFDEMWAAIGQMYVTEQLDKTMHLDGEDDGDGGTIYEANQGRSDANYSFITGASLAPLIATKNGEADANWFNPFVDHSSLPFKLSTATADYDNFNAPEQYRTGNFNCNTRSAVFQRFQCTPFSNMPGTVNWYNFSEVVPNTDASAAYGIGSVYDDNGDPVIQDKWSLFDTGTDVMLGDLDVPSDIEVSDFDGGYGPGSTTHHVDTPEFHTYDGDNPIVFYGQRGYRVTGVRALVTWTPPY